ncbi:DUF4132 domain-containing protein [Nonomuraea sp. NPDC049714]|uniref:DUF4132 domain-containing protein n=1 Tax=Nonomuraea sp. NPDC049714 TaxID=3364357 RepID=UPI00378CBEAA
MRIIDELPESQRGWLDFLDEAAHDVFDRLDAVFDPLRPTVWQPTLAATPFGRVSRGFGEAEWRAMGLWAQLRMHLLWQSHEHAFVLTPVPAAVARRRLRWTPEEIELLWRLTVTPPGERQRHEDFFTLPVAVAEELPIAEREPYAHWFRQARADLGLQRWWQVTDKIVLRLERLVAEHAETPAERARALVPELDGFATLLRDDFADRLGASEVVALLRHWTTATKPRPDEAWLATAAALVTPEAVTLVRDVLARIPGHREDVDRSYPSRPIVTYFHERTAVLVRGMVWTCEQVDEPWVTGLLGDVAVATGTGVGGSGPNARNERTTNAAIGVLARRGGLEVVAQLARVQAKVRRKSILTLVRKTLDGVAERTGLSPEQLLERTVPAHGLGPDGTRTEHGLRLSVDGTISYVDDAGKVRKAVPKAVRAAHGELLAELKAAAKELKKTLPAERHRVERALATGRVLPWSDVRAFYLDHPVTGTHARALIWEVVQGQAGLPVRTAEGWELADPRGRRVSPGPETPVRLWHPIFATPDEVRVWRDHLMDTGLRQPFKQAYREVYLLTPAEERTGDHSLRFAAHILKYGQAKALLAGRGWTGMSLGWWDGAGGSNQCQTVKELPGGLTADWDFHLDWHTAERDGYSNSHCVSGALRFLADGRPVPLATVPPLVLSETLRDADLAVGVTSTGLDPQGEGDYWHSYSFGGLTETAEIRRDALTRLLPRLAIADRAELIDRFLRVRGDLRTYKIHLGSGNILMEPNDAYLCVVPGGEGPGRVFLPFEQDGGMLSIILSKAFLLAADTAITDVSITRQLTG